MEENYEVEKILNHKTLNDGGGEATYFLIKWKGYDESEATWEPECHLSDCDMKITSYLLESKRRKFPKGTYSTRINLLHNHLLDETETLSSVATDLKRKLDKMELELARPPKPMLKKQIIARYEKLPKMGRPIELEVPMNNNKSVAAQNDDKKVLKTPKQLTASTKEKFKSTKSKSESKLSPSKEQKLKYSRSNGIKQQRKIKKIIVEPKIPKEVKKTISKDSRLNRKRTLAETLCQNNDPFGCSKSETSDVSTKINRIEKRPKIDIGDIYEQMRATFWSAHSSSLKIPLSQAQRDAYDQMLDEF